jgi:hypothetical protein
MEFDEAILDRAIAAACPYFQWHENSSKRPMNEAPDEFKCQGCQMNAEHHGGTAGCRYLLDPMIRAVLAAI